MGEDTSGPSNLERIGTGVGRPLSLLVADVGSTMTTLALVDRVNGQHRFVARGEAASTHMAPCGDLVTGVQAALRQIESLVGCALVDSTGDLVRPRTITGDGVDGLVVVSDAAPPMRVLLAGLTRDLSLSSAERAVSAAHAVMVDSMALDEGPARRGPDTWLDAVRRVMPEVILIVGGTDGGATRPVIELAQLVALYSRLLAPGERPVVCYAGNAQLAEDMTQVFAGIGELRAAANVRPSLHVENIAPAARLLDELYRDRWLTRLPGMARLSRWSDSQITTSERSFDHLIRYMARRYRLNVVGVDLGSSKTILARQAVSDAGRARCAEDGSGIISRADLGVGLSVPAALAAIAVERVTRWLPFEMTEDEARDALLHRALHPHSVPQTLADLLLEYALAREVMREVGATHNGGDRYQTTGNGQRNDLTAGQWDLIVGVGRTLTRAPHPGYAALLLLDALEPAGICKLGLDVGGIAGQLGATATTDPLVAAEVVEHDAFLMLGTAVAVAGCAAPGAPALRVTVHRHDGDVTQEEVPGGVLRVIPLRPGAVATLELHPARGLDVGVGQPGMSANADVDGGVLGIVIDTRGRPLSLPDDPGERRRLAGEWLGAMTGLSVPEHGQCADPRSWFLLRNK
jgi:hypothetical protein